MNWISIKEKLPPKDTPILITDGEVVASAELVISHNKSYYFTGHGFGGYDWDFDFSDHEVTHWMLIPIPPKKGGQDGNS